MAYEMDRRTMTRAQAEAAAIDVGLRQHMLRVYNYMASGLALTGIVAYLVAFTPALQALFFQVNPATGAVAGPTMLGWIAIFAPLAFVFLLSFKVQSMSATAAQGVFWAYAGVMGISLASIFIAYTGASVARVFFITASVFAAMSLWGYTTKRDLTGFGSFLFMGLIGIIIAMLVNLFLQSSAMQFVLSVLAVLIFTGLTAYDTQRIKEIYLESDPSDTMTKKAVMGALALYLDFINIFIHLMHLFGERR